LKNSANNSKKQWQLFHKFFALLA